MAPSSESNPCFLPFLCTRSSALTHASAFPPGSPHSPAGSVAASENTEAEGVSKKRQQMYFSLATNTAIDFGFVAASFVPLVLLWIFGTSPTGSGGLTAVWRLSLGLGAIPPLLVLLFRTRMREPEAYQKNRIAYNKLPWGLLMKKYWVRMLAVCLAWWCYDWVSYPAGIYSSLIIDAVVSDNDLYKTLGWNTVLNLFYVIGTLVGALFLVDRMGPKNCMIFGLLVQSAFAFGLAGGYEYLSARIGPFVVVYGLFLAFGEVGPGNCLGLLASKAVAPTAVRGLFYAIAAVVGECFSSRCWLPNGGSCD